MPPRPTSKTSKSNGHTRSTMPAVTDDSIRNLTQIFKLLSDDSRLRILLLLARAGEHNVTQLCDHLGQTQPAVSHHLALLRVSGLVEANRQGKHNLYRIRPDFFNELLTELLSTGGKPPRQIAFKNFALTRSD